MALNRKKATIYAVFVRKKMWIQFWTEHGGRFFNSGIPMFTFAPLWLVETKVQQERKNNISSENVVVSTSQACFVFPYFNRVL